MRKGIKRPDLQRARILVCPICKKEFRAVKDCKNRHQKFCSLECWFESRKNPIVDIECPVCKKIFRERIGRKKYCCHTCYSEHLKTAMKGANSHWWMGGKTKEKQIIRTSARYKKHRQAVLERDGYKCTMCGSTDNLEIHHIHEFCEHPELVFEISNTITLCHNCHQTTDNYGYKARWKIKPKGKK